MTHETSASLPTCKLCAPKPPANLVPRPRLFEPLNGGLRREPTLISTPAGFDRMTLLSERIPQRECPLCWASLDSVDDHPTGFCRYAIPALQMVACQRAEKALSLLHVSQQPSMGFFCNALFIVLQVGWEGDHRQQRACCPP
jgi:ATP/maltotriose-dependent transcriptional regulator MalT